MNAYIKWATEQAGLLQQYLSPPDVERLVLTRSFYSLLDNSTGSFPRGFPLLDGEVQARLTQLETEIDELEKLIKRWDSNRPLVVLDTNVYIHAGADFTAIDLSKQAASGDWHLLILMVNLDELDRLKRVGSAKSDRGASVRTRARIALRLVEEHVTHPNQRQSLGTSTSFVEVVTDPPRHRRLDSNDDEIVERAAEIQAIAGRAVRLVTTDTGMLMRGRAAGLEVRRLDSRSLDVGPAER